MVASYRSSIPEKIEIVELYQDKFNFFFVFLVVSPRYFKFLTLCKHWWKFILVNQQ